MSKKWAGLVLGAALTLAAAAARAADAVVAGVEGSATVTAGGRRSAAVLSARVPPGGKVVTGPGASVLLLLADGTKIRVGPDSVFAFEEETASVTDLRLLKGLLTGWIRHMDRRRLNVRTATAVASVRGTVLEVRVEGDRAYFDLFSGSVWMSDRFGRTTELQPGQTISASLASGLSGTANIGAGRGAPAEPPLPPGVAPAPTGTPRADNAPPPATESAPAPDATANAAPPPPPTQQKTVVSPSAP